MDVSNFKSILGMPVELRIALDERCHAIDSRIEFTGKKASETLEDRVLLKLAAYEECCVAYGFALPLTKEGKVDRNKALNAIRHMAFKTTERMNSMYEAISGRCPAPNPLRHNPENRMDRLIDGYEVLIAKRGYGPPRSVRDPAKASQAGCAKELGCKIWDFDSIAKARLDALVNANDVGPIYLAQQKRPGRIAPRVLNPAHTALLAEGLASFGGRLPRDPLYPGRADEITIGLRSGVGVSDIQAWPQLHSMITDAATTATLVDHPLLAQRRYTYADLIAWARDVERLDEATGEDANRSAPSDDQAEKAREADPEVTEITVASRKQVHALREYLARFVTGGETELVPYDFKARLERAIANDFKDFDHGWRGLASPWIVWNDQYRATKPLPENLGLALRILLREVGLSLSALRKAAGGPSTFWADGATIPTHKSEHRLKKAAALVRIPFPTLKAIAPDMFRKRSFAVDSGVYPSASRHLPVDFETLGDDEQRGLLERNHWRYVRQGLPYGRRHAYMKADEYAFPRSEWAPEMQAAFESSKPTAKRDQTPLRGFDDAARKPHERGKRSAGRTWRKATSDIREDLLTYLFGYWTRPREVDDLRPVIKRISKLKSAVDETKNQAADDDVPDFVKEGGLGIPRELIKPGLLALHHLTLQFSYWKTRRSGRYVQTIADLLTVIAPMLRPETGIIWNSPEMIADMENFIDWWNENPHETIDRKLTFDIAPFRKNWQKAVKKTYSLIMDDIALAAESDFKPSRDSKLPIAVFLDDDFPMERYMIGVRTLLNARPQVIESQHVHTRDCVQTLILIQTGLRTYNMMLTIDTKDNPPAKRSHDRNGNVLGPTLIKEIRDGVARWIIKIPSSEFKNWYSPFFKGERPYEKTLADEDNLYALLEKYLSKSRPYFLKGRRSDALFVSARGSDMNEAALALAYRIITGTYFISNPDVHDGGVEGAMIHGMHPVRHIIATHIIKVTGSIHLAAWAIQDAPATVEKHYAKFIPADKVKHADKILEGARAASRATNRDDAHSIRVAAFMAIAA